MPCQEVVESECPGAGWDGEDEAGYVVIHPRTKKQWKTIRGVGVRGGIDQGS
jgi:hypothetical protein